MMMVKNEISILVIGCRGQLGTELMSALRCHRVTGVDIDTLDITDIDAVRRFFDLYGFDIVINCAAFVAVDAAESRPDECAALNDTAVATLCNACKRQHSRMIHISTDYVFDGKASVPYTEDEPTAPTTVYGATKLAGEHHVKQLLGNDGMVIRTAWLYSSHGNNFVKTMQRLGRERERVNVVVDQIGSPTSAASLAGAIATIIDSNKWQGGIYHYTDEGVASWYDLAVAVMELSGLSCQVMPVNTDEYPTTAVRPRYSVLDKHKIRDTYGVETPHWRLALKRVLVGDLL